MLVRFSFPYGFFFSHDDKPNEDGLKLVPAIREVMPDFPDPTLTESRWKDYVADFEQVFRICPRIEIKEILGGGETLATKLAGIDRKLDAAMAAAQLFNAKCNVHVPGIGLMLIDEVEVENDFCSEKVQDRLCDGWRILAICPQPDQRRPDYIFGRTKPIK